MVYKMLETVISGNTIVYIMYTPFPMIDAYVDKMQQKDIDASKHLLVSEWFENRARCGRKDILSQSKSQRTK